MKALLIKALVAGVFGGLITALNNGSSMDFAIMYMLFLILMDAGVRQ